MTPLRPFKKTLHGNIHTGKTGFDAMSENIALMQDADLEDNPDEHPFLLNPLNSRR